MPNTDIGASRNINYTGLWTLLSQERCKAVRRAELEDASLKRFRIRA
jgi:hypothetical protein